MIDAPYAGKRRTAIPLSCGQGPATRRRGECPLIGAVVAGAQHALENRLLHALHDDAATHLHRSGAAQPLGEVASGLAKANRADGRGFHRRLSSDSTDSTPSSASLPRSPYISRPSSPDFSRARERSSLARRSPPRRATSTAAWRGTTTTPSRSPTMTSPGRTSAPAQTTSTLTQPAVALTVPWAEMAFAQTGKFMAVSSLVSRTPASMANPTTPCARQLSPSNSPNMPSSDSEVVATTKTSPGATTSMAAWIIRLSPGWHHTVTALPDKRALG